MVNYSIMWKQFGTDVSDIASNFVPKPCWVNRFFIFLKFFIFKASISAKHSEVYFFGIVLFVAKERHDYVAISSGTVLMIKNAAKAYHSFFTYG